MADLAPLVARFLFWSLAVAVVAAPRRWAVLAYLVVVQVDVSGPGWASPTAVGLENAIKIIGLPLILLLRLGLPAQRPYRSPAFRLWVLFTGYVAIASIWSPYHVSAVKMVVYLVSYAIVFLIFTEAWRTGLLNTPQIVAAVWLSLLLALVQTYALGNPFGSSPKLIIEQARFTTFSPPQSYAAFLASAAALLLFLPRRHEKKYEPAMVAVTGVGIAIGLVLVGSRYVFVGAALLLLIWGNVTLWTRLHQSTMSRASAIRAVTVAASAVIILVGSVATLAPDNRIFAVRKLVDHGRFDPNAIGTFEWRLDAYHTAIEQVRSRSLIKDVVGSGTSSGARPVLAFNPTAFPANTIDANRALHDEFLRAFYEWGVIGFAIFIAFLMTLIIGFARSVRPLGVGPTQVFWFLLPTLLLGLLLENVLAGSGTPVGTGFTLVIALATHAVASSSQRTEIADADTACSQYISPAWR